jgi:hypothetical protein
MTTDAQEITQLCGHAAQCDRWDPPRRAWLKAHNCDACEALCQAERERIHAEGTLVYLRYGEAPASGYSANGATGGTEAGVSAYPAWKLGSRYVMDLGDCGFSAMWLSDRPVYVVTGTLLEDKGSDGEPLLSGVNARRLPASATVEWLP